MLKEKVLKFNERNKLFAKGDRIVVGVSGGKDSVCLLDILNRCKEEYELSLLVVHINHCLRGDGAFSNVSRQRTAWAVGDFCKTRVYYPADLICPAKRDRGVCRSPWFGLLHR